MEVSQNNDKEKIVRIDPFTDIGFKQLFGKKGESEPLLIDFLNDIFKDYPDFSQIKEISYQSPEKIKDSDAAKGIIYDINCETESGHKFIVEMQNARQHYFLKRAIYYVSCAISEQGHKGVGDNDWEFDFKPVAGIFICNFKLGGMPDKLISHVALTNLEDRKPIGNYVHYVFIQPKYFNKSKEECESGFDIWMYYLKNMKTMQEIPFKTRKEAVYERLDRLSRYSMLTDEEKYQYNLDLKWARDYNASLKTALRDGRAEGLAEGRAEGLAEGRAEGLAEGRAEGLAEGRAEGLAEGRAEGELSHAWKSAELMFADGWDYNKIAKYTGLPLSELTEKFKSN